MRQRRSPRLLVVLAALSSVLLPVAGGSPSAAGGAPDPVPEASEIRSLLTAEFGVPRPAGLAYQPLDDVLLVAGEEDRDTAILRLAPIEKPLGTLRLPDLSHPATLAFDASRGRLTGVNGHKLLTASAAHLRAARPPVRRADVARLGLRDPQGATFDPARGTWFILDAAARAIVQVPMSGASPRAPARISLEKLGAPGLQGIALNPADGLLYVASPEQNRLYGLSGSGTVKKTFSLSTIELDDLRAMVFAPSADPTDDPDTMHLYMADAGGESTLGRIAEVTLAAEVAVSAPVVSGTLVQTIHTSQFNPPSPDPAGVTYMPGSDRLMIADSEVDEMTIFQGVNLFQTSRTGSLTDTGDTTPFTKEPTGLGFDPATGTLYISSDSGNKVFIDRPGPDGRYGTSDDQVSTLTNVGSTDAEGVEYDTNLGHLFVADGVGREVYDVDPVNGVFGDGDDVITHFDVEQYGVKDPEGIGHDAARDVLIIMDRQTEKIYELTRSGALVRIIDTSDITGIMNPAGVTLAPATNDPSRMNYWIVDRGVDNGVDPNENDGILFEVSAPPADPPPADAPPAVAITSPADGSTVSGTVLVEADASDDNAVTQVQFFADGAAIDTDTNEADGWSVLWDTAAVTNGSHSLTATATDTGGNTATSAPIGVAVSNGTETTLDISITVGRDDVEERTNGRIFRGDSHLDLVLDGRNLQTVGLRFTPVNVPRFASITNAHVQFESAEAGSTATSLTVQGEAADNATPFTTAKFNVSSRPRTPASIPWSPPAWTAAGQRDAAQRTPNLTLVLQEIVDRPGWSSGNAVVIIITGSGRRVAEAFEGSFAPALHIEYVAE